MVWDQKAHTVVMVNNEENEKPVRLVLTRLKKTVQLSICAGSFNNECPSCVTRKKHLAPNKINYYMSTEIYSKQSCQIKMVCQNLETI